MALLATADAATVDPTFRASTIGMQRSTMFRVLYKAINLDRGLDTRPGMKQVRRHAALFHGLHFVGCIDGYCKLSSFGIDLYGANDGYPRKLVW